jgi:tetratricopeptide (TPR) repeat protein
MLSNAKNCLNARERVPADSSSLARLRLRGSNRRFICSVLTWWRFARAIKLPQTMSKPSKADPLIGEIGRELMPGHFFRRDEVSDIVTNLDGIHRKLEVLVKAGEAMRAVSIYEIMLSGVYAKIEEADDECDLAMLFHRLACGWIRARQAADLPGEETMRQLLNWMKNDNYGFCHEIEKEVIKALDRKGRQLFIGHFQQLVEKALPAPANGAAKAISDYENDVRLPAMSLKDIYQSLCDAAAYAALCEQLGFSPRDCERLAEMEISKKHWVKALEWVEKGIALEPTRNWHNESNHSLKELKPEILLHLGRKEDALALAWSEFQENPGEFTYEDLMRYAPRSEKAAWHERAMAAAASASIGEFISLCVKAKEWARIAQRVHSAKPAELEALSHYCTEPAAKALSKKVPLAAAKLYRALGLRILNAGKSKYYDAALDHFEKAHNLYCGAGQTTDWEELAATVRNAHLRKRGFLVGFEQITSGKSRRSSPYAEQAQEQWKRLTS